MHFRDVPLATLRRWAAAPGNAAVLPALERRIAELEAADLVETVLPAGGAAPRLPRAGAPRPAKAPGARGRRVPPGALVGLRHAAAPGRLSLTLYGIPRTKKTSNRVVRVAGKPKVLPSAAWTAWRDSLWRSGQLPSPVALPVGDYTCTAVFYRDRDTGDVHGFYQGLADVLEEGGVIPNDKYIKAWDGSRLDIDRACPRVEVTLTRIDR